MERPAEVPGSPVEAMEAAEPELGLHLAKRRRLSAAEESEDFTPEHTDRRQEVRSRPPIVLPGIVSRASPYGLIAVSDAESGRASRRTRSSASLETSAEEKETGTSPELGPGASWSVARAKGNGAKGRGSGDTGQSEKRGVSESRGPLGGRAVAPGPRRADDERMSTSSHSPAGDGTHAVCWDSDALPSPSDLGLSEADDEEMSPRKHPLPVAEKKNLARFAEHPLQSVGIASFSVPSGASSSKGYPPTRSPFVADSDAAVSPAASGSSGGGVGAGGACEIGGAVLQGARGAFADLEGNGPTTAKATPAAHSHLGNMSGVFGDDMRREAEEDSLLSANLGLGGSGGVLTVEELLAKPAERAQEPREAEGAKTDFDCLAALIQDALGEAGGAKRRRRAPLAGFNAPLSAHPASASVSVEPHLGGVGNRARGASLTTGEAEARAESDGEAVPGSSRQSSLRLQYDTRNGGTYEEDLDDVSLSVLLGQPDGSGKAARSASADASTAASVSSVFPSEACSVYAPGQHGRPTQSQDPAKERQRRLARDRETLNLSAQIAGRFKSCRTEDVMRLFRRYLAASSRQVRDPATLERVVAACCYISSRQAMDGLSLSDICHEMDASNGQDARPRQGRVKKPADEAAGRPESDRGRAGASSSTRCKSLGKWVVRICRKLQLQSLPEKEEDPEDRANRVLARVKQLLIAKMEEEEQRRPQLVDALVRATQDAEQKRLKGAAEESEATSLVSLDFLLGGDQRRRDDNWDGDSAFDSAETANQAGLPRDAEDGRESEIEQRPPQAPNAPAPAPGSQERQALNAIEALLAQVAGGTSFDCFGGFSSPTDADLPGGTLPAGGDACAALGLLKSGRDDLSSAGLRAVDGEARASEAERKTGRGDATDREGRPGDSAAVERDADMASSSQAASRDDLVNGVGGERRDGTVTGASGAPGDRAEKNGDNPAAFLGQDICPSLFDPVDLPGLSASRSPAEGDSSLQSLLHASPDGDSSPFSPVLTSLLSASLPPSETLAKAKETQPAARLQLQRFTWLQKMRAEALEKLKKEKDAVFRGLVLLQRILQLFYDAKQDEAGDERDDEGEEDGEREGKKRHRGWTEEDPLDKRWRARGRCDSVSLASLIIIVFKWMQIPVPQRIALDALHVDRKSVYKRRLEQMQILKTLFGRLRGMMEEKGGSSSPAPSAEHLAASLPPHLASLLQQVIHSPATMQRLLALADEEEELGNFISSSQSLGSNSDSGKAPGSLGGASSSPPASSSLLPIEASPAPPSFASQPVAPSAEAGSDLASSSFLAAFLAQVAGEREGSGKAQGVDAEKAQLGDFQSRKKRRTSHSSLPSADKGRGSLYDSDDREASSAVPSPPSLASLCSSLASSSPLNPSDSPTASGQMASPRSARSRLAGEATLHGVGTAGDSSMASSVRAAEGLGTPGNAASRLFPSPFGSGDGQSQMDLEGCKPDLRGRSLLELGSVDSSSSFALGFTLAEALLRHGLCLPSPQVPPATGLPADAPHFPATEPLAEASLPAGDALCMQAAEGFSPAAHGKPRRGSACPAAASPASAPYRSSMASPFGADPDAGRESEGREAEPNNVFFDNRATRDIIASFLASASADGHLGSVGSASAALRARHALDEEARTQQARRPLAPSPKSFLQNGTARVGRSASGTFSSRRPSSRVPPLPSASAYRSRPGGDGASRQRSSSPSSLFAAAASMAGALPGSLAASRPGVSGALSPALERPQRDDLVAQGLEACRRGDFEDASVQPSSPMAALALLPPSASLAASSRFFGASAGRSHAASATGSAFGSALALGLPGAAAAGPVGSDPSLSSSSIALGTVAHLKAAEKALLDSVPDSARVVSLQFERTQQRWVCKWQRHKPAGAPANRKEPWHRRCFSVIKYGYEGAHALAAAVAKKLRDGRRALLQQQRRMEEEADVEGIPRDDEGVTGEAEEEGAVVGAEEEETDRRLEADGDTTPRRAAEEGKQ
ncbi:unnamed protein product [Neospora caninum Liverpool]|uniref:AP2 domain transcription factor AP2X-3 n=1 Tax=Neospora caninum (strain Liverpool) TaxID=572307 RepID=F0VMC5_NEOCL|nr:uncharacterized protein NCLIV_048320 [Neospora caninum Liverpool]CBZ54403.1 unnamed protein product [Neospora caninum Liverpool]|eukprot:XP_003884433.1 uncharacterized protein NCLIV_048320 [Neospora caninum Liverpool]